MGIRLSLELYVSSLSFSQRTGLLFSNLSPTARKKVSQLDFIREKQGGACGNINHQCLSSLSFGRKYRHGNHVMESRVDGHKPINSERTKEAAESRETRLDYCIPSLFLEPIPSS